MCNSGISKEWLVTIQVALAEHMLNELKYLVATPRDTEQDIKLASE